VYGMEPGETKISALTESFSVSKDLIVRVICAENENLNVVDEDGNPVIAASYRQSEFGEDNIDWNFVPFQKVGFVNSDEEERRETEDQDEDGDD
jgi:hypothetical protein